MAVLSASELSNRNHDLFQGKKTSCHTSMFAGERQNILGFDVPVESPAKLTLRLRPVCMVNPKMLVIVSQCPDF